jgi:hypothetical protein
VIVNSIFSNNVIFPFNERIDDAGVIFLRGSCETENLTINDNNPNEVIYEEL